MTRYVRVAIPVLVCILVIAEGIFAQEAPSSSTPKSHQPRSRGPHHHRKSHRRNETRSSNETLIGLGDGDGETVNLNEKDKYESTYEEGDDYNNYTYIDDTTTSDDVGTAEDDKFIETENNGIISEHTDFVLLRLKHISMRTTSNITELLALQEEEFETNQDYKYGWARAVEIFNETKREKIFANTSPDSIVRKVPEEYHIAVVAYTLSALYSQFNRDTREVCSGTDIDQYTWKSYFKILQLAIETLGREERWRDNNRFLYRGASIEYVLKEDQVIAFQHFISTSAALTTAENFAGKSLFEFEGFYNGTAMAVWDHSYYEHEKEVLFSPLQVFRVDSIHVGTHYTRYVLVKHETPAPCEQLTTARTNEDHKINSLVSSSVVHGNSVLIMTILFSCVQSMYKLIL
ncbi:NAD(P)(+)--arginine ADP-ribosyltransferase 2 [Orchesella cincta]|uniref:NAD(P)(+)--arginine ADP-ribosyltransferase n=1 Tax=Orchesella cincta TaxID=48709 RepID=A0A1D2MDT6_ORCCI|nr:NAD(P)(+)--arginine ADP-ribosyltransferase 2 [Orchesella cincta]